MANPQLRRLRLLLGSAALLAFVGLGNTIFGHYKAEEYRVTLSEANARLTSLNQDSPLPLLTPPIMPDPENQPLRVMESRMRFYEYVALGGKCMLALAATLLLGTLSWGLRSGPGERTGGAREDRL